MKARPELLAHFDFR
uniref:Uncharacterized protein n=1 Tax=Arundo donax TaxID=35708 RepID=A0A0A9CCW5_ARUDO